jgi:hypothetical protein
MELNRQSSDRNGILPPGRELHNKDEPIFDQGLAFDLTTLMDRRQVIKLIGSGGVAVGLMTILGCTPGAILSSVSSAGSSPSAGSTAATGTDASCATIPEETAGPFPGDGSNGPDVLSQSGVVRSDIRSSFGTSTGGKGRAGHERLSAARGRPGGNTRLLGKFGRVSESPTVW